MLIINLYSNSYSILIHITLVDTLLELKKLLGLNAEVFFYIFCCWFDDIFFIFYPYILFLGHITIFFCNNVIFGGFLT